MMMMITMITTVMVMVNSGWWLIVMMKCLLTDRKSWLGTGEIIYWVHCIVSWCMLFRALGSIVFGGTCKNPLQFSVNGVARP